MKKLFALICLCMVAALHTNAQTKSLHQLQQEFVDLRCGMFIHFNMPTFFNEDWPDPDASPELFNPKNGLQTMGKSCKICQHDLWLFDH